MLTQEEKKQLLTLARQSISQFFDSSVASNLSIYQQNSKFIKKQATFVTLTDRGELRGCIGHLVPMQELYKDIIENAKAAAFEDPRFIPLKKDELAKIKIEISILEIPNKLDYRSNDELIKILNAEKPGVILKADDNQATFLPQVWEELSTANEFLTHLCAKAGLSGNYWRDNEVLIELYKVEKFKENDKILE